VAGGDPVTMERFERECEYNREMLGEIRDLIKAQNERVRKNTVDIAGLRTWVSVVGGLGGVLGGLGAIISSILWILK